VHGDDQNQREQDGRDDSGELPEGQRCDQHPGHGYHEDQATW
jgi:hypothetical protein